jgi:UDPglucose 6-dehydrogenase
MRGRVTSGPQRRAGFGGGCLRKDIRPFPARAGELGADQALTFLKEVDNINMRRGSAWWSWPGGLRRVAAGRAGGGAGCGVQARLRRHPGFPTLNVAAQPQLLGAVVRVTDPAAVDNSRPGPGRLRPG